MLLLLDNRGHSLQHKLLDQLVGQGNKCRKGKLESKPLLQHKPRTLNPSLPVSHRQELLHKRIPLLQHPNQAFKELDKASKNKLEQIKIKVNNHSHKLK